MRFKDFSLQEGVFSISCREYYVDKVINIAITAGLKVRVSKKTFFL